MQRPHQIQPPRLTASSPWRPACVLWFKARGPARANYTWPTGHTFVLAVPGAGSFCRLQCSALCMHADACLFLLDSIFEICPAYCTLHSQVAPAHTCARPYTMPFSPVHMPSYTLAPLLVRQAPPPTGAALRARPKRTSGGSAPAGAPAFGRLPDLAHDAAPHLAPSGSRRRARYAPSPAAAAHFSYSSVKTALWSYRSCPDGKSGENRILYTVWRNSVWKYEGTEGKFWRLVLGETARSRCRSSRASRRSHGALAFVHF